MQLLPLPPIVGDTFGVTVGQIVAVESQMQLFLTSQLGQDLGLVLGGYVQERFA